MTRRAFSYVKQTAAVQLAWLVALAAGIAAGRLIPAGPYLHGVGIGGQMLTWDGLWYYDIAQHGYRWDPALGTRAGHYQNVAYFPGYAMIEWAIIRITGNSAPWLMILPGLIGQACAVAAFRRFAGGMLPPREAALATWLFALWPAVCFTVMGYPAGLVNFCAILTLSRYGAKQPAAAALWCGIGTLLAPTMVFVAAALCLDFALREARILRRPVSVVVFGLATVSGLLAYMLYLAFKFHDPFVFTKAQDAFNLTPPPLLHIATMLSLKWYFLAVKHFGKEILLALHHHEAATPVGRQRINQAFQLVVNLGAVIAAIAGLIAAAIKFPARMPAGAGVCVLLGYLWFIASTDHNLIDGTRLIFPAIGLFLGLGGLAGRYRPVRIVLLAGFAVLSVTETALIAAGYAII